MFNRPRRLTRAGPISGVGRGVANQLTPGDIVVSRICGPFEAYVIGRIYADAAGDRRCWYLDHADSRENAIRKRERRTLLVNSVARLSGTREFTRGRMRQWNCRAGQNSLIIRTDGTLAPCFPLDDARQDWGAVGAPRFDVQRLQPMKQACQPRCFSTLNHNIGYCYDD